MSQTFQVTGELVDPEHVTLDQRIPLPVGKVRVIVQEIEAKQTRDLAAFESALRHRQEARNHVPPTKEEVDAYRDP